MADESYPDGLLYHQEHDWANVDGDQATVRQVPIPGRSTSAWPFASIGRGSAPT